MEEEVGEVRARPTPTSEGPHEAPVKATSAFEERYRQSVEGRRKGLDTPFERLFSPAQVIVATLLFSPLGGGLLVALNFQRLGNTAAAWVTGGLGAALAPVSLLLASVGGASGGVAALTIWALVALMGGHLARVTQGASTSEPYRVDSWAMAILLPLAWCVGGSLVLVAALFVWLQNANIKW